MSSAATVRMHKTKGLKKRRYRRKPKCNVRQLCKEVSRIKKDMTKSIEIKNVDSQIGNTTPPLLIDNLGTFLSAFANPVQGVGNLNRVGDEVDWVSLYFNYLVRQQVGAATLSQIRVILLWDHENNLTSTDVLDAFTVGSINAPLSMYPRGSRGTFTIIYDKLHTLDATENTQEVVSLKLKLNKKTRFAAGSTTADRNQLRCFLISNETLASGVQRPQFTMNARVWYRDA